MLAASGTVHFGNRILTRHLLLKSPLRGQVNITFGLRSNTLLSTELWLYLGTVASSQNAMIVWTNLRFLINKHKVYSLSLNFLLLRSGWRTWARTRRGSSAPWGWSRARASTSAGSTSARRNTVDRSTSTIIQPHSNSICIIRGLHFGWLRLTLTVTEEWRGFRHLQTQSSTSTAPRMTRRLTQRRSYHYFKG